MAVVQLLNTFGWHISYIASSFMTNKNVESSLQRSELEYHARAINQEEKSRTKIDKNGLFFIEFLLQKLQKSENILK